MVLRSTIFGVTTPTPINSSSLPHASASSGSIHTVLGLTFGIVGGMAMLMLAISGLRYVLSNGDPQKISRAKSSIIYALVGVAVAISGEAIVHYVIANV